MAPTGTKSQNTFLIEVLRHCQGTLTDHTLQEKQKLYNIQDK